VGHETAAVRSQRPGVTRDRWSADFRGVPAILDDHAPAFTLASFVVVDGLPGALPG